MKSVIGILLLASGLYSCRLQNETSVKSTNEIDKKSNADQYYQCSFTDTQDNVKFIISNILASTPQKAEKQLTQNRVHIQRFPLKSQESSKMYSAYLNGGNISADGTQGVFREFKSFLDKGLKFYYTGIPTQAANLDADKYVLKSIQWINTKVVSVNQEGQNHCELQQKYIIYPKENVPVLELSATVEMAGNRSIAASTVEKKSITVTAPKNLTNKDTLLENLTLVIDGQTYMGYIGGNHPKITSAVESNKELCSPLLEDNKNMIMCSFRVGEKANNSFLDVFYANQEIANTPAANVAPTQPLQKIRVSLNGNFAELTSVQNIQSATILLEQVKIRGAQANTTGTTYDVHIATPYQAIPKNSEASSFSTYAILSNSTDDMQNITLNFTYNPKKDNSINTTPNEITYFFDGSEGSVLRLHYKINPPQNATKNSTQFVDGAITYQGTTVGFDIMGIVK